MLLVSACGPGGAPAGDVGGSSPPPAQPGATTAPSVPPPTPSGARPPRTLTPADDGAVVPLRVGDTVELVVPAPDPQPPRVEGTAVNLVEVVSAAGTPHREWEVRAVQQGHSVVRGDRPEPWAITFRVTA